MTHSISKTCQNPLERLEKCIKMIEPYAGAYCMDPVSNFTRNRKLPFTKLISFLIQLGAKSINSSICEYFLKTSEIPSASAVCQARDKLDPAVFYRIIHLFNKSHHNLRTVHGWHILAFDGSAVNVPFDQNDPFTLAKNGDLIYSQYHLNAVYDVFNDIFYDCLLDSPSKTREVKALMEIMDRGNCPEKSIYIEDRGICSYELLAKCQEEGRKIIVRSKEACSASGMLKNLPLPETDEFDITLPVILTRKQTKEIKEHPELFKPLHWGVSFPLMPPGGDEYYALKLRVVRQQVDSGKFITVITNLEPEEFPAGLIKDLYRLRWREEVAFLQLKYPAAMLHFHSRKRNHVQQEILASILLYNLCSISLIEEQRKEEGKKKANGTRKYKCKFEFGTAVTNVRLLLCGRLTWKQFTERIKKFLTPIRPGRTAPRKVKRQWVRPFAHRAA